MGLQIPANVSPGLKSGLTKMLYSILTIFVL
jgi:hypothetical protein